VYAMLGLHRHSTMSIEARSQVLSQSMSGIGLKIFRSRKPLQSRINLIQYTRQSTTRLYATWLS